MVLFVEEKAMDVYNEAHRKLGLDEKERIWTSVKRKQVWYAYLFLFTGGLSPQMVREDWLSDA